MLDTLAAGFWLFSGYTSGHNAIAEAMQSAMSFWIYSALIQTMPPPARWDPCPWWYQWLYDFAQLVGANWRLVAASRK